MQSKLIFSKDYFICIYYIYSEIWNEFKYKLIDKKMDIKMSLIYE